MKTTMSEPNLEQQPQAPEQRVEEPFRRALKFSADLKNTWPEAGQELLAIVADLQRAVKGLMEQVMAAQEEERRRIARELHDGVSQSLAALVLGLEVMYREPLLASARPLVDDLRRTAAATGQEVRRLARGLRPSVLDDLGLAAALERHASECAQAHGIAADLQTSELGSRRLPATIETALYRIAQEALANTVKHARAQSVSIIVGLRPSEVQMTVSDDGCGFDLTGLLRTAGVKGHLGLSSMQERATLLNGATTIESRPGSGTTVCVRIPLEKRSYDQDPGADRG